MFCYVNSVFAPGLDEGVGNLWRVSIRNYGLPWKGSVEEVEVVDMCCVVLQDRRGAGGQLFGDAGFWVKGHVVYEVSRRYKLTGQLCTSRPSAVIARRRLDEGHLAAAELWKWGCYKR